MVADGRNASGWGAYVTFGVAAALLAAAIGDAQAQAAQQNYRGHDHRSEPKRAPPTQAPAPASTLIIVKVEPSAQELHAAAEQSAAEVKIAWLKPESWTVLFNALLVLGTGFLWLATKDNAVAANRAARVAERALVELERPYVFVKFGQSGINIHSSVKPTDDGGPVVEFTSVYHGQLEIRFVNVGRSPAILTHLLDIYDICPQKAAMPYSLDPERQHGRSLPVGTYSLQGDPHVLTKPADEAFGRIGIPPDAIADGYYCLGLLGYEDILGGKYLLGYCALYDWGQNRFVLTGGEEYNFLRVVDDGTATEGATWLKRPK